MDVNGRHLRQAPKMRPPRATDVLVAGEEPLCLSCPVDTTVTILKGLTRCKVFTSLSSAVSLSALCRRL
jgi:hypothetical protein